MEVLGHQTFLATTIRYSSKLMTLTLQHAFFAVAGDDVWFLA